MKNKIILFEGTDASGKTTQTNLLKKRLENMGQTIHTMKFPVYDSPTGKIVGGSYLGKPEISECLFPEGSISVDPKVAGLLYAADRLYNVDKIYDSLNTGHIILDRYVDSNIAHQGAKIQDKEERYKVYNWFDNLEYKLLELPEPDIRVLLYMPREYGKKLKISRGEALDGHEIDEDYLSLAETAYLEVAQIYNYIIINCVENQNIRSPEDISNEVYERVMQKLMAPEEQLEK